jgi:undecaprenyl-diphosphatase
MIEFLAELDTTLFHILNSGIANPVFDFLMPIITDVKYWIPIYALMFIYLAWRGGENRWGAIIAIVLVAVLTDQINSSILKEFFARPRPCHTMENIRLLVDCGAGKSFPSSHAANNFALATVLSFFYRRWKWVFITLASAVAFSRTYIGVHYPLDLVAGAIVGFLIASAVILFVTRLGRLSPKIYIPPGQSVTRSDRPS